MAIKATVQKRFHNVADGIVCPYLNTLAIATHCDVFGFGPANVVVQIDPEDFREIARAMLHTDAAKALAAFEAALEYLRATEAAA